MSKQILTIDKDTTLDSSIIKLQQFVTALGFHIVEQSTSNPIDNIWSICIRDRDCSQLATKGSGITKQAALMDALYLFIENLSSRYFWANFYLGSTVTNNKFVHHSNEKWFVSDANGSWPDNVLNTELHDFYNPIGELNSSTLIDIGSSNPDRGLCCIPFKKLQTNDEVYFPVNIIDNIYTGNGLASGTNAYEAGNKALSQILENYIQFKVIAEGISLPDIPTTFLDKFPRIKKTINDIEQAGFSLLIKDASLNGKYPVTNVILLNPNNQSICNSFGANPNLEIALQSCLTQIFIEFDLDGKSHLSEAGFDLDEISSPKNLAHQFNDSRGITAWESLNNKSSYEFYDWSKKFSKNDNSETFKQLCKIIQKQGNEIFIAEYNNLDFFTCRVIVPSMSEIYPVDDLVWENNNAGMNVRDRILNKNLSINECDQLIEDLEDLDLDDELLVSTLIGMPADLDSIFYDLSVAELILLLALKTQDNERMQEGCEWIIDYEKTNQHRLRTYKCINTILQLDSMTNYSTVLEKLYSRKVLNDALALIDGEDVFPLVSEWKKHNLLLEAYKKIVNTD